MELLKEYASAITAIVTIGGFFVGMYKVIRSLETVKTDIDTRLKDIDKRLDEIDVSACKNFLVRFLKDVEQGNEVDEVEIQRAHEVYKHYYEELHQNSYIHSKWNKLIERDGK